MDWLTKLAPTVASFLSGPLAGIAVHVLGDALGLKDITKKQVDDLVLKGQFTGEQLTALRQAEMALIAKQEELGIRADELIHQDRANARAMFEATQTRIPGLLAILVTSGFFGILSFLLVHGVPVNGEPLLIMLGALGSAWMNVIMYYFGSTASSRDKNQLLAGIKK